MSRAAPWLSATAAQTVAELRVTSRRGENLLAMVGIPVAVLLFFGSVGVLAAPASGSRVSALLPGTLALAIIGAGFVNLGIATAYERSYGVLKRLGGSPLGRSGLVAAKILAIVLVEMVVVAALTGIAAVVMGWQPGPSVSPAGFAVAFGLGTVAFAALGLALAGTMRAEAVLALANALFIASLLLGGVLVPVEQLPGPLAGIASVFPAGALTKALSVALGARGDMGPSLLVLAVWAAGAVIVATRWFRWD